MNFPFELNYSTAFQYHPKLQTPAAILSHKIRDYTKGARVNIIGDILLDTINRHPQFEPFFKSSNILVPIPKSSPLVDGALWPSLEFASFLFAHGLSTQVSRLIERKIPIRKSAISADRPTVREHLPTLALTGELLTEKEEINITLVDDVLTKGNTSMACALKIKEKYPLANVRLFTVVQTKSLEEEFTSFAVSHFNRIVCYESLKIFIHN